MASVRELSSGRWQVLFRDAEGRQRGRTFATATAAAVFKAQHEEAVATFRLDSDAVNARREHVEGAAPATPAPAPGAGLGTLGELLDLYDRRIARHQRSYATQRGSAQWWGHELGRDTPAAHISPADIYQAILELRTRTSGATASRYLAILQPVFKRARFLDAEKFAGVGNPVAEARAAMAGQRFAGAALISASRNRDRRLQGDELERLITAAKRKGATLRRAGTGSICPGPALLFGLEQHLSAAEVAKVERAHIVGPLSARAAEAVTDAQLSRDRRTVAPLFGFRRRQEATKALNAVVRDAGLPWSYATTLGRARRGVLTAQDWQALTDAARRARRVSRAERRGYALDAVIAFAAVTGLRRAELVTLQWCDIERDRTIPVARVRHDLKRGRVVKNDRPRDVPLTPEALAVLDALEAPADQRTAIFPVARDSITQAFGRLRDALGIDDLKFHDMRHEALSRLAETYPLSSAELQLISGHKDRRSLDRYVQARLETVMDKIAAGRHAPGARSAPAM